MTTSPLDPDIKIVQREASTLASNYTSKLRAIETVATFAFFALTAAIFWRVGLSKLATARSSLAVFLGWVTADLVSGTVHWAADTWGRPEWPVIGQLLIRPFREHHVDPMAITRHDFFETNGSNALISLPVLSFSYWAVAFARFEFIVIWLTSMTTWVILTSQIHKWAHQASNNFVVRALQRWRLILSSDHHALHHKAPFTGFYCITSGWMNWPMMSIGAFRAMEAVVSKITGAIPREDDIGRDAAVAFLARRQTANAKSESSETHTAFPV